MNEPHCKICDEIGHTAFYCPQRPRVQLTRSTKNWNHYGKYTHKWKKTKKLWKLLNPPNHEGYYECYIDGQFIPAEEIELDHVESRSRRRDLRYDLSNIKPICHKHNREKGSLSFDEYIAKIQKRRNGITDATAPDFDQI